MHNPSTRQPGSGRNRPKTWWGWLHDGSRDWFEEASCRTPADALSIRGEGRYGFVWTVNLRDEEGTSIVKFALMMSQSSKERLDQMKTQWDSEVNEMSSESDELGPGVSGRFGHWPITRINMTGLCPALWIVIAEFDQRNNIQQHHHGPDPHFQRISSFS